VDGYCIFPHASTVFSSILPANDNSSRSQHAVISIEYFWHIDCGYPWQVRGGFMEILKNQKGAIGWILLWVIGIPIPILLLLFLVRGCT
jgi:hypothetical protein